MQQREFRAMGSRVLALVDGDEPVPLLDEVPAWFEAWEQGLSRFRIDSELTQLNAAAGTPRRVSQELWDVLGIAVAAESLTAGLVSPLILEDLLSAGYDRSFDLLETQTGAQSLSAATTAPVRFAAPTLLPSVQSLIVDRAARTVCLPDGVGLDFGGLAKGWAADEAVRKLMEAGSALVSAGGDVAVSGPRPSGEPWRIGVEDPFGGDDYIEMLYVESAAGVATSGRDHRHWQRDGLFQHHIIDPRTHRPALTDVRAATVIASTVMRAEAFAKAALISGAEAGLALLNDHEDVEGLLVLDDGRRLFTRGIELYL